MRISRPDGAAARVSQLLGGMIALSALLSASSWLYAYVRWRTFHDEGGGMWARWNDKFADIEHYDKLFPCLHRACFFTQAERFAYPAPSIVVYDVFLHFGALRLGILIFLLGLIVSVAATLQAKVMTRYGLPRRVAVLFATAELFLSWPLMFLIERANIEIIVFAFVLAGVVFWARGQARVAATMWGFAAALKLYPILLLVTFLHRRRIGALCTGILVMATTVLASAIFVGPSIAVVLNGSVGGVAYFVAKYGAHVRRNELQFDHSLLALCKSVLLMCHAGQEAFATLNRLYLPTLAVAGLFVLVLRLLRLGETNRLLLASCAMLLLPPASYDYTLINLYPSLTIIVLTGLRRSTRDGPAIWPLLVCITLLLSPENFLFVAGVPMNGAIKAIAFVLMITYLLCLPLPELHQARPQLGKELTPAS